MMERLGWINRRLAALSVLAVLVVFTGCELSEPPGSSTSGGEGMAVQLVFPPGDGAREDKAPGDTLRLQLFYLGTDSLAAIQKRPAIDDGVFDPVVSLDLTGDETGSIVLNAVSEPTLWRLMAETGTLLGQTTFTLNPTELQRNVRLVFAEAVLPDTLVLYNSFAGQALSEPTGMESGGNRVIYPVGLANGIPLTGLDFRFVLSAGTEVSVLVDPGSRLFAESATDLTWELRKLDFVTDGVAYRLEITTPPQEIPQTVLEAGSDVLFYIVADGTGAADDLCIHGPSASMELAGGDRVRVALDTDRCSPSDFPPLTAVSVEELGNVAYPSGQSVTISWTVTESWGDLVRVDLIDHLNGDVCETIADQIFDVGFLDWDAARCSGPTAGYRIRVTDIASGEVGETTVPFLVGVVCALTVTSPNGGETWEVDSTHTITWATAGDCGETVQIGLLNDGLCPIIAENAPNTGEFIWESVEQCSGITSGYVIWILDNETEASDQSDSGFNIVEPPRNEPWK